MNDQIYLILILVFIILVLSRFIVRLYNSKAKGAIFFFRMLLGFLIAMLLFVIVEAIRGNNVIERFFGS